MTVTAEGSISVSAPPFRESALNSCSTCVHLACFAKQKEENEKNTKNF